MNSDDSILLTHDGHGLLVKQDALNRVKSDARHSALTEAAEVARKREEFAGTRLGIHLEILNLRDNKPQQPREG